MTSVPRLPDIGTRIQALEKAVQIIQRTSRLSNASIGSGGLTVYDGGSINIEDGGDFLVNDGGQIVVDSGGQIALTNGGLLNLNYPASAGGVPFLAVAAIGGNEASTRITKSNGYTLFHASVEPLAPEGQVRIGQQVDPNPPGIFLEGRTVGVGSTQNIVLAPGNLLRFIGLKPQAGTANMRINESGDVGPVTSLRASKTDIQPLEVDTAKVLAVEPVTYTSKAAPDDGTMAGVIAEQVEEVGGLEPFLTYDSKGNLSGFDYGAFPMALLAVAQQQAKQIAELTARINTIEEAHNG